MQLKLSTVFLQETEYLKSREQQIQQEEQSLTKRVEQLKSIQNQQKQIENQFTKLKNRMETTVAQLIKFQTNGVSLFFFQ
jgi:molecular chaperone GrpE (heat shock protein)